MHPLSRVQTSVHLLYIDSVPDQLTDFNFTVESDNRAGFFQHHVIHLEWEQPQSKGLVYSYVCVQQHCYVLSKGDTPSPGNNMLGLKIERGVFILIFS